MRKIRDFLLLLILYYPVTHLLVRDTGCAMVVLLYLNPILLLALSYFHGKKASFQWTFSILVGLLWLPNCLFMNESVAIYGGIYLIVSLIGQTLGWLEARLSKNEEG